VYPFRGEFLPDDDLCRVEPEKGSGGASVPYFACSCFASAISFSRPLISDSTSLAISSTPLESKIPASRTAER